MICQSDFLDGDEPAQNYYSQSTAYNQLVDKYGQAHLERRHQCRTLRRPVPPDRLVVVRAHARLARLRGAWIRTDYCQPGRRSLSPGAAVAEVPQLRQDGESVAR